MANFALERNPYFNGNADQAAAQARQQYAYEHGGQAPQQGQQWQQYSGGAQGYQQGVPQQGFPQQGVQGQPQQQWQNMPTPGADQLGRQFDLPSPSADQMERMTVEDTVAKGAMLFGLMIVVAAVTWFLGPTIGIGLAVVGSLVALVLSFVIGFRKEPSVPAIVAFTVAEGLLVGGFSVFLETLYPGVVIQAVLATLAVIGVTLVLFRSNKVRTSPKATKFFIIAGGAYLLFSLVNFGLMMFGVMDNPWGMRGIEIFGIPLGVVLGIFAVLMGAYMLIADFEFIQNGARAGAPRKFGWLGAYAVISTVVFIYIELLRLLAILRGND